MVIIVDNVAARNEEGSDEAIVKAAKGIEQDVEELRSGFYKLHYETYHAITPQDD